MMRLKPQSPMLPAVALLAATASCDRPQEDVAAPPAVTIRDSAGIEIVESHAPEWDEADVWTVATEPAVVIGGYRGAGEPAGQRRREVEGRLGAPERGVQLGALGRCDGGAPTPRVPAGRSGASRGFGRLSLGGGPERRHDERVERLRPGWALARDPGGTSRTRRVDRGGSDSGSQRGSRYRCGGGGGVSVDSLALARNMGGRAARAGLPHP